MHPIHTTLTNVTFDRQSAQITAMVRVFETDLNKAVAKRRDTTVADYVRASVGLSDQTGHPVPTTWCGSRREGDVVWLCLRAPAPQGASGLTLSDRLLFDVFDDQVNIVMTEHGSVLFTKGDAPRRLP
jgi:hypothetical protein